MKPSLQPDADVMEELARFTVMTRTQVRCAFVDRYSERVESPTRPAARAIPQIVVLNGIIESAGGWPKGPAYQKIFI
jgi:hypothetical protein